MKYSLIMMFLVACNLPSPPQGNLGERCKPDGTCNGESLECGVLTNECHARPKPRPTSRCTFESECFCVTCAEKCGEAGVKTCAYSDTSVWGSKPAICECK